MELPNALAFPSAPWWGRIFEENPSVRDFSPKNLGPDQSSGRASEKTSRTTA